MNVTKETLRGLYATHPVCPDCGERAVRPMDDGESAYRCDACETELGDDQIAPYTDGKVRVEDEDEVYDPDLGEIDDVDEPELGNLVGEQDVPVGQGGSQVASSVLFGLGVMLCLTIVGIPFGLAFIVIARKLSPNEPEWQGLPRGDDDDDDH